MSIRCDAGRCPHCNGALTYDPPVDWGDCPKPNLMPLTSNGLGGLRRGRQPQEGDEMKPPALQTTLAIGDLQVVVSAQTPSELVTLIAQTEGALQTRALRNINERAKTQTRAATGEKQEQRRQERAGDAAATNGVPRCPDHKISRPTRKTGTGGFFCPAKTPGGGFCDWTAQTVAA